MSCEDARLLDILQTHGQAFLASFNAPQDPKRLDDRRSKEPKVDREPSDHEEEWGGIDDIHKFIVLANPSNSDDKKVLVNNETEPRRDVIVFSEQCLKKPKFNPVAKAQSKSFMSSKASKITANQQSVPSSSKLPREEEEERGNAENDALLHKLVHTKLLSGSLNHELDLTHAQRQKALAGRVMEITGQVKLGKGEKAIRSSEKNKASKQVREGLSRRQQQRSERELEEAKNLGNYHPTLKRLFEATSPSQSPRKRERGMKMGVGKFSGGFLKLGHDDIDMMNGTGDRKGRSDGKRKSFRSKVRNPKK